MVEPDAVLEVADGVLDLGVARTPLLDGVGFQFLGFQFQGVPANRGM